MSQILRQHRFQFVCFCDVHHAAATGGGININDDHHAMHVLRGTGEVTINKISYPLARGSVIAVPPFVEFIFRLDADFAMRNIHYRLWSCDGEPIEHRWMLPLVFTPDYFDRTQRLLNDLIRLDWSNTMNQARTASIVHEIILDHWLRTGVLPMRSEIVDRRIEKIHDILISSQYKHYDAQELAHTCCLSISQMNRLFSRTFHRSPQKFWEEQRLSAICVALKRNTDPIGEIASEFGFDEPAYFSRWFKKRAGCSAIAYREKLADSGSV